MKAGAIPWTKERGRGGKSAKTKVNKMKTRKGKGKVERKSEKGELEERAAALGFHETFSAIALLRS